MFLVDDILLFPVKVSLYILKSLHRMISIERGREEKIFISESQESLSDQQGNEQKKEGEKTCS